MPLPLSGGFAGASCLALAFLAFLAGALEPGCAFAGVGVGVGVCVGVCVGFGAGFAAATVGAAFLGAGLGADFLPTNISCNPRPICSKRLG